MFANVEELDAMIAEAKVLRGEIYKDGQALIKAQALVVPPGDDIMSRMEARATVDSLRKAIDHNKAMFDYVDAQVAKLRAARGSYAGTDADSAARLRGADEGSSGARETGHGHARKRRVGVGGSPRPR